MNLSYEKVFNVFKKIPYYFKGSDPFKKSFEYFSYQYNDRFNAELEEIFRKRFPKRKNFKFQDLDEETIAPIRERYLTVMIATYKKRKKQTKILDDMLFDLAPITEIVAGNTMYILEEAPTVHYNSTGNSEFYARMSLESSKELLERFGCHTEIREVLYDGTDKIHKFELWANLEDWQFDCILRNDHTTLLEWAVKMWSKGINPKVLSPMMSEELFQKSLELHMDKYKK